jgi:hypothetical protein
MKHAATAIALFLISASLYGCWLRPKQARRRSENMGPGEPAAPAAPLLAGDRHVPSEPPSSSGKTV